MSVATSKLGQAAPPPGPRMNPDNDQAIKSLIVATVIDAYYAARRGDREARAWLRGEGQAWIDAVTDVHPDKIRASGRRQETKAPPEPSPSASRNHLVSGLIVASASLQSVESRTYPGGMVPEHKHEKEEEVMFFLAGRGTFVTEDREIPLEPGVWIYNPPGKTHKIINTGDEVLRFVWIYSPPLASHRK